MVAVPPVNPNFILANPTKDFFINMLVRDIPVINAVADLADNCVDGARRLRPSGDYSGLRIDIEVTQNRFLITDNCGGMSVEVARNYAFRFGRPDEVTPTSHSIGQFGVGMKRALFRLGRYFNVSSSDATSRFSMSVDVDEWSANDLWRFAFDNYEEGITPEIPVENRGTTIRVERLHEAVAAQFGLSTFVKSLVSELQAAHQQSMENNLIITVNRHPLQFQPPMLLASAEIQPAFETLTRESPGRAPVFVRIYAGIAASEPLEAGWYVVCNGRLVLEANQRSTTGWGEGVPKYHNQFAEFRGWVYFDSEDAEQLPWTTTKAGVDADSPLFQSVRLRMITLMRPVIDFLNKLDSEINTDSPSMPMTDAYKATSPLRVSEVRTEGPFRYPTPPPAAAPTHGRITYSKPLNEIRRVQESLGVSTYKDLGEKTFEYYLEMECPD